MTEAARSNYYAQRDVQQVKFNGAGQNDIVSMQALY